MSRVHDALRKAETFPNHPAAPFRPSFAPPVAVEIPLPEPQVESEAPVEPEASDESAAKPKRWRFPFFRKFARLLGFRTGTPPKRCSGVNRKGEPCGAPSMANGFCYSHGGSRHTHMEQHALDLWQRIGPQHNESEAIQ